LGQEAAGREQNTKGWGEKGLGAVGLGAKNTGPKLARGWQVPRSIYEGGKLLSSPQSKSQPSRAGSLRGPGVGKAAAK
jgi:hypothetical protein